MTLDEVLRADAAFTFTPDGGQTFPYRGQGVRVAQLSEVLAAFPKLPMTIEIKQARPSVAVPFCRALRAMTRWMAGQATIRSSEAQARTAWSAARATTRRTTPPLRSA